jgi:hypothetical protein
VSTVSGTVYNVETGQPLANADVAFYKQPEMDKSPYVATKTDAYGRYSLELSEGSWRAYSVVLGYPQVSFEIVPDGVRAGNNVIITVPGPTTVDFLLWNFQ